MSDCSPARRSASRSGIGERAQAASARSRPLPVALAARTTGRCTPACHSSSSRLGSGQFCVQPCCALQSAAKVHDQSTGTATPLEPHGNVRCQARGCTRAHERVPRRLQQPAAPSCQTPPSAAARAPPRILAAWPAPALSRGRAALAYNSSSGAPTPGGLASRHEPRSRQPTPSAPPMPHLPPPPRPESQTFLSSDNEPLRGSRVSWSTLRGLADYMRVEWLSSF